MNAPQMPANVLLIPRQEGLEALYAYARELVETPVRRRLLVDAAELGVDPDQVIAAHNRARDRLAALEPGEIPPFDDFESLPPGVIDHRVWESSSEVWADRFRIVHTIADPTSLSDLHLWNVLSWMAAGAEHLLDGWTQMWQDPGESPPDGDALDFLLSRPLGRQLIREPRRRRLV